MSIAPDINDAPSEPVPPQTPEQPVPQPGTEDDRGVPPPVKLPGQPHAPERVTQGLG